jgi:hypothetical protein
MSSNFQTSQHLIPTAEVPACEAGIAGELLRSRLVGGDH